MRSSAIPVFLLAALFAMGAAAQSQKRATAGEGVGAATAAFQAGTAAYAQGDLPSARESFARAVKLAPQVPAAHVALGVVLQAMNRPQEAEKELLTALRLDPNERSALVNLAVLQAQQGSNTAAVATLGRLQALSSHPAGLETPDVAMPLAAALTATGDSAQALTLLLQAQGANPDDALLADAVGTVLAAQGRFDEANVQLRHALVLDPSLAAAHYHLGSVALDRKQIEGALPLLQRAHELEPKNTAYTLQLAQALLLSGAEEAAVLLLRDALAGTPPGAQAAEVRYRLALALQSLGQIKEALPLFAQVLLARPNDAGVLTNAALAQVQNGDAPAGIALYRKALAAAPPTATLREDLGVAYLQQGDQNDALEQFRLGLQLEPDNPQLHYDLGLALKLKDNLAAAIPEFEKAAQLDPSLPDPPYTLGIIYMQQGRFADAAASLLRVIQLRPDNGDAWATLGSVYRQLDQPEKAEPALRQAILLLPDQPSPHITLAAVLTAQGKREEAAAERKRGAELTKVAVNRQKAQFLIDSGTLLLKRGQVAEALAQLQEAVATDPALAAGHTALANALERSGRKAEAAEEQRKASLL